MPDSITSVIQAVLGVILLVVFIIGLRGMVRDARRKTRRFNIALILSLLVLPAMFSTCATINLTSKDKAFDGLGFRRPVPMSMPVKSFETRGIRRERSIGNIWLYVSSVHGAVSMVAAMGVGVLLLVLVSKFGKHEGAVSRADGYWAVLVPFAIGFLVLWNFAEIYKYGPNRDDELPVNVQSADESSTPFPPPTTPPPPPWAQPPTAKQSPSPKTQGFQQ
ncbi:MAG: hypothetical protein ACT4OT_16060 [Acidobacteriota bacterium]